MKTPKLALLILAALVLLLPLLSHGQTAQPPPDSVLAQLKTELKGGEGLKGEGLKGEGLKGEGLKGEGLKGEGLKGEGLKGEGVKGEGVKGEGVKGERGVWAAGTWTVSPFASYRAHELGAFDGKFGAGLAVSYALVDNIALELETLGEEYRSSPAVDSLEEAGANFKGYLPIGGSGLAAYGLLGYTRNLQIDQNRMNAGAGLEVRARRVYAFADGRWTHDFVQIGHALFRLGVGAHF